MTAKAKHRFSCIAALALLAAALAGCASIETEPLGTGRLQQDAKDPRIGVVVLRFRTEGLPPAGTELHDFLTKASTVSMSAWLHWRFAVANESTGWSFRVLEEAGQVFHTRNDSIEPDAKNAQTGWVTFLAPPGTSYVAVMPVRLPGRAESLVDEPRIAVRVHEPREIAYAGTIVATLDCSEGKPYRCPYELTLADEPRIARSFVARYLSHLALGSPMQSRLFTIPPSRTIPIRER